MDTIIIHWSEIGLKGKNRPEFVTQLAENVRKATRGLGVKKIARQAGGLALELARDAQPEALREKLQKTSGIANFMTAYRSPADIKALKAEILEALAGRGFKTFAVRSSRADKSFPLTSQEVSTEVGEWVRTKIGAKVDLSNPELTIYIEITPKQILFGFEKIAGLGGLPVGSSGKVVAMLSGGIDSPVASQMMMKRGCRVVFVHFHSYPYLSKTSQEKVEQLLKLLNAYQGGSRLYLVPFGDLQKQLLLSVPARYLVVLYRRFMFRIAERIAQKERARALVTGESVGQVASQTLENMAVIGSAVLLPVLRPLVGMNKEEIIARARNLDTYDISIIPDQDCCQLFVPRHPATAARTPVIEEIESRLEREKLIEEAMKNMVKGGW